MSGYAVGAAMVAGLFALFLAAVVVSAVTSRRSPLSYELLILAAVGWVTWYALDQALGQVGQPQTRERRM